MIKKRQKISGSITLTNSIKGSLTDGGFLSGNVQVAQTEKADAYMGPYTVTPSQDTQIVHVKDLKMVQNITVEPIPSYYGRVSYNGSVITIT